MIKKIFGQYLGIDETVLYTVLSRGISAFGGLFSIFLILKFLTKDEQGYYYTFLSLISIQMFFELGLSNIIVQYVAHEFALISNDNLEIENEQKPSKLTPMLHFFTKWYLSLALFLIVGLILVGVIFFRTFHNTGQIDWLVPWICLSVATGLLFVTTFYLAFMEGLGRIKQVVKIRFIQQSISIVATSLLLIFGAKLYTSGVSGLITSVVLFSFILSKPVRSVIYKIWQFPITEKFYYKRDILPYQWRIAISWIGGYLIFQMFNPVLFAFSGAKAAGQMGATLAVLNGILSLSLSWVSTKIAFWCRLIALKNVSDLKQSFRSTLFQSSFINFLALIVFCVGIFIAGKYFPEVQKRFIPNYLLILFSSTFFFNNVINCWATYLRCFKKEPFLLQATIVGVLCALSTYFLGRYYGLPGLIIGYFAVTLFVSLPLSYYIYDKFKVKFEEAYLS